MAATPRSDHGCSDVGCWPCGSSRRCGRWTAGQFNTTPTRPWANSCKLVFPEGRSLILTPAPMIAPLATIMFDRIHAPDSRHNSDPFTPFVGAQPARLKPKTQFAQSRNGTEFSRSVPAPVRTCRGHHQCHDGLVRRCYPTNLGHGSSPRGAYAAIV